MNRSTAKRWLASGACVAALGAFATLASGITVVSSKPFYLAPSQRMTVMPPPPATTPESVAVRVSTRFGTTLVQALDPAPHGLGQVTIGRACVFEGPFARVDLLANSATATQGEFEVRGPIVPTDLDRLIGFGTLEFGTSTGTFTPYGNFDAAGAPMMTHRMIAIDARLNVASVSVSGIDAAGSAVGLPCIVEGGDWGFCSRGIAKFTVTGRNAVPFSIYDPIPTCPVITGVAMAQGVTDRDDEVSVDGARDLEITLTNQGPGSVRLEYDVAGVAQTPFDIPAAPDPANFRVVSGRLTKVRWTYAVAGHTVTISVRGF